MRAESSAPAPVEKEATKPSSAEPAPPSKISEEVAGIFAKAHPAVVRITADDEHGQLCGTGFLVNPNGTIFTTYSVAGESWNLNIELGDKTYSAVRLVADAHSGLAVLKILKEASVSTPFLPFGKPSELNVASPLVSIGYPMDLPATPNVGYVAGFDRKYQGGFLSTTHLRANIPVHRGEQGSPILNLKGEVVGILVARMDDGKGTAFALPITAARKVFLDYERFGAPRPGWIGVQISAAGEAFNKEGTEAVVGEMPPNSPAAKAGIKEGDVLLEVAGVAFKRPSDMVDVSFFLSGGDRVPVKVRRGDEVITVQVRAIDNPHRPASKQLNEILERDRDNYFETLRRDPEQYVDGETRDETAAPARRLKLGSTP
ncbi:MAG: trypsin-like peptidase domain-containing protein [Verrucomicrobia bacterium]|nr:trypsin-like peptidase domain-containing protein [Verrucomicrobiota bacterium]